MLITLNWLQFWIKQKFAPSSLMDILHHLDTHLTYSFRNTKVAIRVVAVPDLITNGICSLSCPLKGTV